MKEFIKKKKNLIIKKYLVLLILSNILSMLKIIYQQNKDIIQFIQKFKRQEFLKKMKLL